MGEERKRISISEMQEAIKRSGYLVEQRVKPIFEEYRFFVISNSVYQDLETKKTRELDILASKRIANACRFEILCECENNFQPVVFFRTKKYFVSFQYSPTAKTYTDNLKQPWLPSIVEFSDFHHYYKAPVSSQYCTFQLNKRDKKWISLHTEEQHDTFNNLVKALRYMKNEHDMFVKLHKSMTELTFYYVLLIFQGDLYEAFLDGNSLVINNIDHIIFMQRYFIDTIEQGCYIDVIREKYLYKYIKTIKGEIQTIAQRLSEERGKLEEDSNLEETKG